MNITLRIKVTINGHFQFNICLQKICLNIFGNKSRVALLVKFILQIESDCFLK